MNIIIDSCKFLSLAHLNKAIIMGIFFIFISSAGARAHCERLDFESIMVEKTYDGKWELTVSGETPRINMDVALKPRPHETRPNFWQIEVVGCYPGLIGIPLAGRFNTTINIDDARGRKGVAILGATYFQKKRF